MNKSTLNDITERVNKVLTDYGFDERLENEGYIKASEVMPIIYNELGIDVDPQTIKQWDRIGWVKEVES